MNTRINKRLVELGLAPSRRKADELIETGRVSINSITITDMATKVSAEDVIEVDGRGGQTRDNITVAFYKPVGYVSSHARQTSNQRTIFDILPAAFATLKVAGRLDKDSQGLMILSSDGGLIHTLSHPSFIKPKVYLVTLDKPLHRSDEDALKTGVRLRDGLSKFDKVTVIRPNHLRITLHQGKNRQIRRSFEALGYDVKVLERTAIGNITSRGLKPGAHVFIQPEDIL